MPLILANDEIAQVLSPGEVIEALRRSYLELADSGEPLNRARTHTYLATGRTDEKYVFKSMEGGSLGEHTWALRISSDIARTEEGPEGRRYRYLRYGELPEGKGYSDLILLFDITDAQFVAILHAAVLQGMRVAGSSALGSGYLARHDAASIGVFGSGWQARFNLEALCAVRPNIQVAHVFSPTPAHRQVFAQKMTDLLRIEVQAVDRPVDAVRGMDIVLEASGSITPVFDGAWLTEGQHVVSVGAGDETIPRRPIDPAVVRRAQTVAVNSKRIHLGLDEIDDIIEEGQLSYADIPELADLVAGRVRPVVSASDITLFKNNVGLGSQFAAVGALAVRKAREQGLGREIPADWLSQLMSR